MLFEYLERWVPHVFRQGELALSFIDHPEKGLTQCLNGCLGQWFFGWYCQCS